MAEIPPALLQCVNLVSLSLSRNSISAVMQLSQLRFLATLDLSFNRITSLNELRFSRSLQVRYATRMFIHV